MALVHDAELTERIIGAAIRVHRTVGPGLLESAYREFMCDEMRLRNLRVEREKAIPVTYGTRTVPCGYRADLIVEDTVLVELKTVPHLLPVHQAQALTYMRLAGLRIGLLLNFHAPRLANGIKRLVL